jgi:hypothetical protein
LALSNFAPKPELPSALHGSYLVTGMMVGRDHPYAAA